MVPIIVKYLFTVQAHCLFLVHCQWRLDEQCPPSYPCFVLHVCTDGPLNVAREGDNNRAS